mgnify:CR=1 FL=1
MASALDLCGNEIFIEEGRFDVEAIEARPRVGIASFGDAAFWPLRFSIKDNIYVSPAP